MLGTSERKSCNSLATSKTLQFVNWWLSARDRRRCKTDQPGSGFVPPCLTITKNQKTFLPPAPERIKLEIGSSGCCHDMCGGKKTSRFSFSTKGHKARDVVATSLGQGVIISCFPILQ